jgi:hypothetical protein
VCPCSRTGICRREGRPGCHRDHSYRSGTSLAQARCGPLFAIAAAGVVRYAALDGQLTRQSARERHIARKESRLSQQRQARRPAPERSTRIDIQMSKDLGTSHLNDDRAVERWLREKVGPAYDALKADPSRAVTAAQVRVRLAAEYKTCALPDRGGRPAARSPRRRT